jgi:hypothetical protein
MPPEMTESEKYFERQRIASLTQKCSICGKILGHGHIYEIDGKWCHRVCWINNQPTEWKVKYL